MRLISFFSVRRIVSSLFLGYLVIGVALWFMAPPASPDVRVQFAEALPHTHSGVGVTTGTVGYIEQTSRVAIIKLKDGSIVQALISAQTEPFGVGQRVRVEQSVGHHGESLFTVLGPARRLFG